LKQPVLLLGHLDTVWPLGTLKTMPCRLSGGRLSGPGTLDMKAGVAMALTALEMLVETGSLEQEIVLLLNSDEEVGSPVSRPITERLAAECGAVYVMEPAQGLPARPPARAPAIGESTSRELPRTPAWISKKAQVRCASWRM